MAALRIIIVLILILVVVLVARHLYRRHRVRKGRRNLAGKVFDTQIGLSNALQCANDLHLLFCDRLKLFCDIQ